MKGRINVNRFQKCLTGVLCASMVAALAGCGDTAWTHRSANAEVTSGMYIGFTIDAARNASSAEGYDAAAAFKDMTLDGVSSFTWVQNTADTYARQYLAVEEKFVELGLSFTAEEQAEMDNYVDAYWSYIGSTYEEEGCGQASFAAIITNNEKQSKVFEALYGEGGAMEVPAEELRAYFDENYLKGSIIVVPLLDDSYEALEGEELEVVEKEAEELLKKIEDGADFEQVKAEYEVKDIEGAQPEAEDTAEYITKDSLMYPEALINALEDAADDEVGMAQDEDCIYIWQKQARDDEGFEEYRSAILSALKGEDFSAEQERWGEALEVTVNDASVKKHAPRHLSMLK